MSINKIAQMAGVSPSTVSRVLNNPNYRCSSEETRDKIWKAAMELNYTPNEAARSLKLGKKAKEENKTYYIIESNHDTEMLINGPYPEYLQRRILSDKGHLSNELCAGYLSRLIGEKTKKIILAHLSESNNTPSQALETVNSILLENQKEFSNIICASQHEITEVLS